MIARKHSSDSALRTAAIVSIAMSIVTMGGTPVAAGPGSYAQIDRFGGSVVVRAYYTAPQNCWRVARVREGAPTGQSFGSDTPVTVRMNASGYCRHEATTINGVGRLGPLQIGEVIRLFFVAPDGRVSKVERVAVETGQ